MDSLNAFATTLPVLLLVILGFVLHRFSFFTDKSILDLKKLVVNIALPLVLLNAFGSMFFQPQFLLIVVVVFVGCVFVMQLTIQIGKRNKQISEFTPMIMAGFEAGMLGYAVYTSLYGLDRVKEFAIIDLGQVLFVFFILVPALQRRQYGSTNLKQTIFAFLRTPVILAIFVGIFLNFSGLYPLLQSFSISAAVLDTSQILGSLTMPLAALILGYELNIQPGNLKQPIVSASIRMVLWVGFAAFFNLVIIRTWLGLGQAFEAAVWFMFVLPPPFVVPLYLQKTSQENRNYILNTITLSTLFALIAMVILRMVLPG
jgi:predicted permease